MGVSLSPCPVYLVGFFFTDNSVGNELELTYQDRAEGCFDGDMSSQRRVARNEPPLT
jgi:hypothetical protein